MFFQKYKTPIFIFSVILLAGIVASLIVYPGWVDKPLEILALIGFVCLGVAGFLYYISGFFYNWSRLHNDTAKPPVDNINFPGIDAPPIIVQSGAQLQITINIYDYLDGLPDTEDMQTKEIFLEARKFIVAKEYPLAIEKFQLLLGYEKNPHAISAVYNQIGHCYYMQSKFIQASEYYTKGLNVSKNAGDDEGLASAYGNIANTFMHRPSSSGSIRAKNVVNAVDLYSKCLSIFLEDMYPVDYAMTQNNLGTAYTDLPAATPEVRADNVRKAIECYQAALEIYRKDEYPVQYATTQNNLGNSYTYLPAATPEVRADNVRKAIECYQAALEIYRKDEYPQDYCYTIANIGMALISINNPSGCSFIKEAYSFKEFLPDQGKQLEGILLDHCFEE